MTDTLIKSSKPVVGVLGGMGLAATANFLRLFVKEMNSRGAAEDADFPHMAIISLPLEGWDYRGSRDKERVEDQICDGMKCLLDYGAKFIAVPCNSVHEFFDQFPHPETINIIDLTLNATTDHRIGVLCSAQTREARLYENPAFETLYVDDQNEVDRAIQAVLCGEKWWLNNLKFQLLEKGAKNIILGCTELSLCEVNRTNVIDSTEHLASGLADCILA